MKIVHIPLRLIFFDHHHPKTTFPEITSLVLPLCSFYLSLMVLGLLSDHDRVENIEGKKRGIKENVREEVVESEDRKE